MRIAVAGDDIAGMTLALRLRIKGHDVTVHAAPAAPIAEQFTVIAPYRDLFLKSGKGLDDLIGLREVTPLLRVNAGGHDIELPPAGAQGPAIARALGEDAAAQWSALLSVAAETWHAIRTKTFTPTASLEKFLQRNLPDTRLHALVHALLPADGAQNLSDAAIVFPYLRQTFGVWEFDGGLNAFSSALRERCLARDVQFSSETAPPDAFTLDEHFAYAFRAPRRWLREPQLQPRITPRLGLPFIGIAAEMIANRVGRATGNSE